MITKPKCIILDDEELALDALKSKIEEINLLEIERSYQNCDELLDDLNDLQANIFFLDIEMEKSNSGTEIAKKLKNKLVIFVSGYYEHIDDVVNIKPIAFIKKPIKKYLLRDAIIKAINHLKISKLPFIVVKTEQSKKQEIKEEDILYIESYKNDRRDKLIILLSGEFIKIKNYKNSHLISILSKNFLQINHQNIVNLNYTNKLISADLIEINYNGKSKALTLGNSYKEAFFKAKPHFKN